MIVKSSLLVTCIIFSGVWLIVAAAVKKHDDNTKEHCLTRCSIFTAAALIIAALPD